MKQRECLKCILIITVFLLLTLTGFAISAHAVEPESPWSLKTDAYMTVANDPERIVQNGSGIQLILKRKHFYLYASTDVNPIRFAGQSGIDINLDSIGIGGEYEFKFKDKKNSLTLFADLGWYEPKI